MVGDILSHSVKRSPGSPLPAGCKAKVDQQRSLVCKEEKLPSGDEVETAGGGVGWGTDLRALSDPEYYKP